MFLSTDEETAGIFRGYGAAKQPTQQPQTHLVIFALAVACSYSEHMDPFHSGFSSANVRLHYFIGRFG